VIENGGRCCEEERGCKVGGSEEERSEDPPPLLGAVHSKERDSHFLPPWTRLLFI
jgi:hypothetical protein